MKFRKILLLNLLLFVVFLYIGTDVSAMNTGFSTQEMSEEEQNYFLSDNRFSLINIEPELVSIDCFDVREDGMLAIGSSNHSEKYVVVIDQNSNFLYGYSFNADGSFQIQWDGPNIIIYYVRGGIAALYDKDGNCVELKKIEETVENNDYWNHTIENTTRIIGNDIYQIKSDIPISFSYSKLTKADSTGTEYTIYDVGSIHTVRVIAITIAVLSFIAIVVVVIVKSARVHLKND